MPDKIHHRKNRQPGILRIRLHAGTRPDVIGGWRADAEYRGQVVAHPDTGKPASVFIVEDKTLIASFFDAVLGISGLRAVAIGGFGPEALFLAIGFSPSGSRHRDLPGSGARRYPAEWPADGAALAHLLATGQRYRQSGRCTLDAALRATIYCVPI